MKTQTAVKRFAVLMLSVSAVVAKDKPRIVVEVVDTQTMQREFTYNVPGSASQSTSNCNGSATATTFGGNIATANGCSNCTTTTTPGTPARTAVRSIPQAHVRAIMPDGKHITLWCQAGFRSCKKLDAGHYDAEVDGNSVWMYGHDLDGKEHKIKYRYEGSC